MVHVPLFFYFNEDKILGTVVSVSNQWQVKSSGQHVKNKKRPFITTALFVQQSQTAGFPAVELLACIISTL